MKASSEQEVLGHGTLMADMQSLFGAQAADWKITLFSDAPLSLALLPPGAFLIAGILLAAAQGIYLRGQSRAQT